MRFLASPGANERQDTPSLQYLVEAALSRHFPQEGVVCRRHPGHLAKVLELLLLGVSAFWKQCDKRGRIKIYGRDLPKKCWWFCTLCKKDRICFMRLFCVISYINADDMNATRKKNEKKQEHIVARRGQMTELKPWGHGGDDSTLSPFAPRPSQPAPGASESCRCRSAAWKPRGGVAGGCSTARPLPSRYRPAATQPRII